MDVLGFIQPATQPDAAPKQSVVEFMVSHLRMHQEATYKEVREVAESHGYTVSAAAFGRAQQIAGIVEPDETDEEEDSKSEQIRPRRRRGRRDPVELLEEFMDHWDRDRR